MKAEFLIGPRSFCRIENIHLNRTLSFEFPPSKKDVTAFFLQHIYFESGRNETKSMRIVKILLNFAILQIHCKMLAGAINTITENTDLTRKYFAALIAGDRSELSELNMFMTAMPKGGDLHHHYSGSIYVETFLNWVDKKKYCIYTETNLSLKIRKFTIETKTSSLNDSVKPFCISAEQTRQDNGFYRELMKTWSDADYANHYHEQVPPDQQFFDTFGYFGPVSGADYVDGLKWIKNTAIDENVQYIETMLMSGPNLPITSQIRERIDNLSSLSTDKEINDTLSIYWNSIQNNRTINLTINDYVKTLENLTKQISDDKFTLRFQAYVTRGNSPSRVFSSLVSSFLAHDRTSSIAGINIVGPENGIVAMRDYTLHMKMFRFLKNKFPKTRLSMHAGELVLGMVPPDGLQSHIREAIEIAGANRIGHGIDIFYERKSYELLEKMKELNIVVEAIISSNEFILGVKNHEHPMLVYKAHGIPLVIATDDAGVSRSSLTNEYLMYADRYSPTYDEIKMLIYNSIQYSFLSDTDKRKHLTDLDNRFLQFEQLMGGVVSRLDLLTNRSSLISVNNFSFLTIVLVNVLMSLFGNL